jgi:LacI family transcriptional regulator
MKRKVTLKQIAKELDVSISGFKILRNSLKNGDTRLKVQAFAKFYNTDL